MNNIDRSDFEELISGYIDGELSQRQKTEVKRLIHHDQKFARELVRMKKQKQLLNSMPLTSVPDSVFGEVKSFINRNIALGRHSAGVDEHVGARHLWYRRILTVAAMILLVGILAAVIFNILMPASIFQNPVADGGLKQGPVVTSSAHFIQITPPRKSRPPGTYPVSAALNLNTYDPITVNSFIEKAIFNNNLLNHVIPKRYTKESTYKITCPADRAIALLEDLGPLWPKSNANSLTVYGRDITSNIVIENASVNDVKTIFEHDLDGDYFEVAGNIAVCNTIARNIPAIDAFTSIIAEDQSGLAQPVVARPILTSGDLQSSGRGDFKTGKNVTLTIIVSGL